MKKLSKIEGVDSLSNSKFFEHEDIPTNIPLLNVAFSGRTDGGLTSGITMMAGESRTFKTGFLIQKALGFQAKYPDGVVVFYDTEFSPLEYWKNAGVDTDLVLHVPITTIEEMKHDMAKKLDDLETNGEEKILFLCDSVGGMASKKEVEDATTKEDQPVDMTRAKALNSLMRIITPKLNKLKLNFVFINSFYETMEMYSKRVYAGGKKVFLACDDVFFFSRSVDKDGKELKGYFFNLTVDKSRVIKEGSKFPIHITYEGGIDRYSGLYDLAKEAGYLAQSGPWIKIVDFETGELSKNVKKSDIPNEFYENLIKYEPFQQFLKDKYLLG